MDIDRENYSAEEIARYPSCCYIGDGMTRDTQTGVLALIRSAGDVALGIKPRPVTYPHRVHRITDWYADTYDLIHENAYRFNDLGIEIADLRTIGEHIRETFG